MSREWVQQAACASQLTTFNAALDAVNSPRMTERGSVYVNRALRVCKVCPVSAECAADDARSGDRAPTVRAGVVRTMWEGAA